MVLLNDAGFAPLEERNKTMKRLISAALALTLLGATAASAQGYRGGYGGGHYGGHYGHGGGWVLGETHDDICAEIADQALT